MRKQTVNDCIVLLNSVGKENVTRLLKKPGQLIVGEKVYEGEGTGAN